MEKREGQSRGPSSPGGRQAKSARRADACAERGQARNAEKGALATLLCKRRQQSASLMRWAHPPAGAAHAQGPRERVAPCASQEALCPPDASASLPASEAQEPDAAHRPRVRECTALDVREGFDADGLPAKLVSAADTRDGSDSSVVLTESWVHTPILPGDSFSLHMTFASPGAHGAQAGGYTALKEHNGLLVLHPGLLVSATAVGGSYTCARREVLNNRYASDGTCGPAVLGQALHDLFQEVLHERFDCQSGTADPRHVLHRHIDAMHAAGQTEAAVLPRLDKALPQFRDLVDKLSSSYEVGVERMGAKGKQRRNVQVEKVADIEDMYWSHKYGVKGQLDAVLRASDAARAGPVSVPFELKTGRKRNTVEHGAQVVCYTLMMAEKLNATPAYGLMHYADVNDNDGMKRGAETKALEPTQQEIAGVMQKRNELAAALRQTGLPPIEQDQRVCERCGQLDVCAVLERARSDKQTLPDLQRKMSSHLSESHLRFVRHWDGLLALEASSTAATASPWLSEEAVADSGGSCMSNLVLERRDVAKADGSEAELVLAPSAQGAKVAGGLSSGDRAVVSVQLDSDEPFIVSNAAVREVTPAKRVKLLLKKPLSHSAVLGCALEDLSWRVDKEASAGLAARMRGALLALVGSSGPSRLRELVIDLSEARFADQQRLDGSWADSDLNMEQERAVQLMARAHDYALVRGLPGAGKTHTLAAGIRRVMRSGRKVLVCAHTNAAVDNVLSRLIALGEKPLRVGDQSKVSDAVKPYMLGSSGCAYESVEQLSGILSSSRCVGCTCSGVHHPALAQLTFDMCVIDEASQVLLPASLRCLSRAHSFTLCGDHAQLPPLVRLGRLNLVLLRFDTFDDNPRGKRLQVTNEEARRGGLSVSLFERLAEARPETLAPLTIQYRMNNSIMRLNNVITYDGSLSAGSREVRVPSCRMRAVDVLLRCGSRWKHQVADGCLGVEPAVTERLESSNFVKAILSKERSVVFLDQDSSGESVTTTALVCEALQALKEHTSLTDSDYVCMSPYNVEVEAMQQQLRSGGLAWQAAVTVDRAQGLDKRCAIVSVGSGTKSSILSDWRRLNVAMTRARHKLILVGSISGIEEGSPGDSPLRSLALFARREKLAIAV